MTIGRHRWMSRTYDFDGLTVPCRCGWWTRLWYLVSGR